MIKAPKFTGASICVISLNSYGIHTHTVNTRLILGKTCIYSDTSSTNCSCLLRLTPNSFPSLMTYEIKEGYKFGLKDINNMHT